MYQVPGVGERIDYRGEVVVPLNREDVMAAIRRLIQDEKVEAIAVSLLHAWANPRHEEEIRNLAVEADPSRKVYWSFGSELSQVAGEYARANTAIINSYLGPTVERYLTGLDRKLRGGGFCIFLGVEVTGLRDWEVILLGKSVEIKLVHQGLDHFHVWQDDVIPRCQLQAMPGDQQHIHVCAGEEHRFFLQPGSKLHQGLDQFLTGGIGKNDALAQPGTAAVVRRIFGNRNDRDIVPCQDAHSLYPIQRIQANHNCVRVSASLKHL